MATTTNYSWTTPDDTALVKDGAAAIRSLGTAIDTTVFNNASAAIAKTIVDAKGDIIAATAADTVARLAVGANGTVLMADSSTATGLKWETAGGGGKVLQVVQATYATATSITSTTFTDSGLSASITPSATTSKVLVLTTNPVWITPLYGTPSQVQGNLRIVRGATEVFKIANGIPNGIGSANGNMQFGHVASMHYLDSPATTSSTTYKVQGAQQDATDLLQFCRNGSTSSIILLEIGA